MVDKCPMIVWAVRLSVCRLSVSMSVCACGWVYAEGAGTDMFMFAYIYSTVVIKCLKLIHSFEFKRDCD